MNLYEEFKNRIDSIAQCIEDEDYKKIADLSETISNSKLTQTEKIELLENLAEKKTRLTPNDTMSISELCKLMVNEGEWIYDE